MQNTAYRFYRQVQENTAAKCRRKSHRRPTPPQPPQPPQPQPSPVAPQLVRGRPKGSLRLSAATLVACPPRAGSAAGLGAPLRRRRRRRRPCSPGASPCRYMPGILSSAVEFCEGAPCKNSQAADLSKLHKRLEDNFVKNQARPSTLNRPPPPCRHAAAPPRPHSLQRRLAPTAYRATPARMALTACACVYRATSTTIL